MQYTLVVRTCIAMIVGTMLVGSGLSIRHSRMLVHAMEQPGIVIDYPEKGSIFPPEITPPTFLWHDASASTEWKIEITFEEGGSAIDVVSSGAAPAVGEIDPRCISPSNELPRLSARLAGAHAWTPEEAVWTRIKERSQHRAATITISGFRAGASLSHGAVSITTAADPVGAPIFYRDVPLIPSKSETGVIKPLAQSDLPLLAWRLRSVAEPRSRLLLTGMHTCANCHSFSQDGKVMGMDLDGPGNDKGLYMLTSVKPRMSVTQREVISWPSVGAAKSSTQRIGFMSQVSPDGRYVVTMLRSKKAELANGYFVVNFKDYRFLQVFYPTRGTLAWYDRATGEQHPLPGADDPDYVQTNPVWTPDGKAIIFARARARSPMAPGQVLPDHALAPEETQIQFDLYRVSFNEGRGGSAVPIAGASQNGMSNSFPKVTPDGRWIIFVQSRNGLLMRPDSQLYIVPAEGGVARRLACNTPLMNSWHSISPNGHWMVFSSKSRSPYTQMFLTHLDGNGNASPAILIDNATAANRAVNIPEFVNIPPDGMMKIDVPAAESYRLQDEAADLTARGELEPAIAAWSKVLDLDPDNALAHFNLGVALEVSGKLNQGARELEQAQRLDVTLAGNAMDYGMAYLNREQFDAAVQSGDCPATVEYGMKLWAAGPDKATAQAVLACESSQMQAALARADWSGAVKIAQTILQIDSANADAKNTIDQYQHLK